MKASVLLAVLLLARASAVYGVQRCFDAHTGHSEPCHGGSEWDAPTVFTGGRQDASKCMAHCKEPCPTLNGNTEDECGGCPSSYLCRPGASGFGSTLHRPSISSGRSQSNGGTERSRFNPNDFYESLYRESTQHRRHRHNDWRHEEHGDGHWGREGDDGWRHGGHRG